MKQQLLRTWPSKSSLRRQVPSHSRSLLAWNSSMPWHQCTRTPCQGRSAVQCSSRSLDSWHRTWCCRTVWCPPCSCISPDISAVSLVRKVAVFSLSVKYCKLQTQAEDGFKALRIFKGLLFSALLWVCFRPSFAVLGGVGWQRSEGLRQEIDDGQLHSREEVLNFRGPLHTDEASTHHQHSGRPFMQALQEVEPGQQCSTTNNGQTTINK